MNKRTTEQVLAYVRARVVVTDSGCWEWQNHIDKWGYGMGFQVGYRTRQIHRIVYQAVNGAIPQSMHVDHLCRVRRCTNPVHLEAVTPLENLLRSHHPAVLRIGATHCVRGHEFTADNTYRDSRGKRNCRKCNAAFARRLKARKVAAGVSP